MIGKLFLTLWILFWISIIGNSTEASQWSGGLDESLDELHDPEIYRAVVESMKQWENQKKHSHRTKRATSRVCYEEVGCFEDTGPFSYLEMLPSHPKDVGTRFFMYGSRKARSVPMEVPADNINDKANNAIDPDLPTKVIVHGFGSGCEHVWVYEMRSALMSVQDCNIVCVDWSLGSAIPNYVRAAANTRLVGRQLAKLVKSLNVPLEKVHLIGFSLGAHVAGFAGAELGNVSRITGLDPAGPLFESQDPRARLDASDATFVDVIHSNGEQLILGGLGSWQPMGDVDFYPNGGRMQTGCSNIFLGAVSDIIWSGPVEGRSLCNHRRAYKLFTDSVSPKCRFPAFPCESGYDGLLKGDCFPCGINGDDRSCGDMGFYSDATGARGQLYLVTREEEPFCAHQYQLKVYNSRGERPARSYGKLQVTLVGESNFNETFTMTRKDDEELLVGAILQKIVVPHPAIGTLEAIEIKYTAYSGWISSGLASWSIDKISVLDSFGKSLSVCMRGLTLESGRPIDLPLYPGECNIPMEPENSTSIIANETKLASMRMETIESDDKVKPAGGIGPFTKEQNYDRKDAHRGDSTAINEKNHQRKGLGPFTKDQNTNPANQADSVQIAFVSKDGDDNLSTTETRKTNVSPWSYVDVSEAGSNSLENTEVETGRGFSGSNLVPSGTSEIPPRTTVSMLSEDHREVREPVLQMPQKETGRSMRLPEITEPILRPRSTRQNAKNDDYSREKTTNEDLEESSTSSTSVFSRPFTVQFLPERLAGIFAQAERYARRTLLPLISQYTPSFIVNSQQDRVKYFPSLFDRDETTRVNDVVDEDDNDTSAGYTERNNEVDADDLRTTNVSSKSVLEAIGNSSRIGKELESNVEALVEKTPANVFRLESSERGSNDVGSLKKGTKLISESQQGDWIPIKREGADGGVATVGPARNSSRMLKDEGKWTRDGAWNQPIEEVEAGPETKIDDWIPIRAKNDRRNSVDSEVAMTLKIPRTGMSTNPPSRSIAEVDEKVKVNASDVKVKSDPLATNVVTLTREEKKYIPLVDFEKPDGFFASTAETTERSATSTEMSVIGSTLPSHIQKIPSASVTRRDSGATSERAMPFPYAYERRKDAKTRYIPLMPHEEMERLNPMTEWEH